jgi:two-component system chemotaxis response regulator CheY
MLIEPSSMQLKVIMRHLLDAGVHKIDGVRSGQEALDLMERYPPDLVISAMYLPDLVATDLVTLMRSRPALESIPFMLVSSETHIHALEPLRQAGIIAILPKPFVPADLHHALYSAVDFIDPQNSNVCLDSLRVLIADDSVFSRKHLHRVLNNLGVQHLMTAENGREALDLFNQALFDLVITDLNMPEMDGQELIEQIRNNPIQGSIPILMVTCEQNITRLKHVELSGVTAILDKPFEMQAIKDILLRVMMNAKNHL